jgi:hypothetical protein
MFSHGWLRRGVYAAVLLWCVLVTQAANAQLSPGPLSRAHSFLSGTSNCTSCHKFGGEAQFKCLDCHTEIASRITNGRGLHATMVHKSDGASTCRTCHREHYGADVPLIKWVPPLAMFDHARAGWPLLGHHAKQPCRKCHAPEHIRQEERRVIQKKDLANSFLGLNPQCSNCHKEPHNGRFGANCSSCHTPVDWKTVPKFDHSKTDFALTGLHAKVECAKCHKPGADGKPQWKGLKFNGCDSCHKSPHPGAFSNAPCASCHNTDGFKQVNVAGLRGHFDHSTTKYALVGKHAEVECTRCHIGGAFMKPLQYQRCAFCHNPSPHGNQFVHRPDGGECSSCHTPNGFKKTKFASVDHSRTRFPLEGKHATVACDKCHAPAMQVSLTSNQTAFRLKFDHCSDCHIDQHRGQFKDPPYSNRCQVCHSIDGFKPTKFTVDLHQNTSYPLVGAHVKATCASCHRLKDPKTGEEILQFRYKDQTCTACHQDPHNNEFLSRQVALDKSGKPFGCEACHTLDSWTNVSRFDHSSSHFALLGPHRTTKCADCHKPQNINGKLVNANYRVANPSCMGCHADVHGGQFVNDSGPIDCSRCHNIFRWKPAAFDHDTQTSYKLEGEHRQVVCAKCHFDLKAIGGKQVLFYKPTPTRCEACHTGKVKKLAADL